MALNINIDSILSASKREALSSLLESVNIDFPSIKTKISNLINTNTEFESLLNLYSPAFKALSSDVVNATNLLAYLDFYSLYILLYANKSSISNLIDTTKNKVSYMESLYKDIDSSIKEKELQKNNKYAQYINFLNPKNIDLTAARLILSKNRLAETLNYSPILTLPINTSRTINPISISCRDNDNSINIIDSNITYNGIDYSVNRKGFNRIGLVNTIVPLQGNTSLETPIFTGTIQGYYSENIFITISEIGSTNIKIIGSSNNIDWSDSVTVEIDTSTTLNIDSNLDIGLYIKIASTNFNIGDSWKIDLRYIEIEDPSLIARIKFNSVNQISYLQWRDLTSSSLELTSSKIKYRNLEDFYTLPEINDKIDYSFTDNLNNILPLNSGVNEIELEFKQSDYYIGQIGDSFIHKFNFDISDISAVYNEYDSFGTISFSKIDILENSPILNVRLDTNSLVIENSKQFIESYLLVASTIDYEFIPFSEELLISEYIIPNILSDGTVEYITKFPYDSSITPVISNLSSEEQLSPDYQTEEILINGDNIENKYFKISVPENNFNLKNVYVISYKIKAHTYNDALSYIINDEIGSGWIYNKTRTDSSIYYMYYTDLNNNVRIALSTLDSVNDSEVILKPFYGSLSSVIYMRSLDKASVSPMIFEHSVLCN